MGLHQAMAISVSGIRAENIAMELIASNLANISTTNTINGGPYRRRMAVLSDRQLSFADELARAEHNLFESDGGVEVLDVIEDTAPFQKVYNPGHPDADAQGFVSMPNVSLSKEMADMVYVSKLYEANITAYNTTKKMMQDTLQLQ